MQAAESPPRGTRLARRGQVSGQEAKDHSVPPADTGQQPVPSKHGHREFTDTRTREGHAPPWWGGVPPVARLSQPGT